MKYIRKFDGAAAMAAAIASLPRPFVAWDGVAEENINLNFGEPTEAPTTEAPTTTTTEEPTTTTSVPVIDYTVPFYIEDVSGSENTVQIKKSNSNAPTLTIEKSTDGTTWETMGQTSTTAISATVPANGKLYLRCSATQWATDYQRYNYFNSVSGNFNVGGNINSLFYGSSFNGQTAFPSGVGSYTFVYLFKSNTHIMSAQQLLLPATTLVYGCYGGMFFGCTSLTTAPALPATTLARDCYDSMFYGCTNLNYIKCLATNISAIYCTTGWVSNVASSGTFVKDQNMSDWTTGVDGIPEGWTVEDAA